MVKKLSIRKCKTNFTESSWDDDNYTDRDIYYTEEYTDYLECNITLTVATFTESINIIREYIIDEVLHSRDCNRISKNNYNLFKRRYKLIDLDGDPYLFDGQGVVDLVVRFSVDANGEYDFDEYGFDEAIEEIQKYLL